VQESLAAGVDVVCFSGDKLLGGPQAGIILGRKDLLDKVKKHPLARAVRADKLCLAALSATLEHYLKGEAEAQVPVWQMLAKDEASLKATAEHWKLALGEGQVQPGRSAVGGGSLPEETLPTWVLELTVRNPDRFLSMLRESSPPVVARIESEKVVLDPRTVFPEQEDALLAGIARVLR
jgi:L-seryl-tRNA(Ser) seleniumtransferase